MLESNSFYRSPSTSSVGGGLSAPAYSYVAFYLLIIEKEHAFTDYTFRVLCTKCKLDAFFLLK